MTTPETNSLSRSNSTVLPDIATVRNGYCQGRKASTNLAIAALAIPAGLVVLITSPLFIAASLCILPVALPIALCCYCSAKRSKASEKIDRIANHTVQNPDLQNDVPQPDISIIDQEDEHSVHEDNTPSIQVLNQDNTPSIQVIEQSVHKEDPELALQKKSFVEGALNALNSPVSTDSLDLNIQLTEQQTKDLEQAVKKNPGVYDRFTIIRGGDHNVIFLNSVPNVVFKFNARSPEEETIDNEIAIYKKASLTVQEHNLNLIQIPRCQKYTIDVDNQKMHLLAQEKIDVNGNYSFQKGLYRFAFNTPELADFMKTCFEQLSLFIMLTGFLDVKYNNIPLLPTGIVLYDLDSTDGFTGLMGQLWSTKTDTGLLNFSPDVEFLKNLVTDLLQRIGDHELRKKFLKCWEEAETQNFDHLKTYKTEYIEKYKKEHPPMPSNEEKVIKGITATIESRKKKQLFLAKLNITTARQPIDRKKFVLSNSPETKHLQNLILDAIEQQIKGVNNYDLIAARHHQLLLIPIWDSNKNELMKSYSNPLTFYRAADAVLKEWENKGLLLKGKKGLNITYGKVSFYC